MASTKSKRIFFVLGSFKLGGTERTASRIGMELIRRGYDVKFLLINDVFDYNDVLLVRNSIILGGGKNKSKWIKLLLSYFKLLWIVWIKRPGKVVSFSLGINILVFFLFYPQTIFRIETNIFIYKTVKQHKRYLQNFFSWFPHIKKVVVPSRGLYDACVSYFSKPEKLTLISNPLDIENIQNLKNETIDDLPELDKSKYIISAGRLSLNKGFGQLIKVYKKSNLFSQYKLLILGNGPMYNEIVDIIRKEDLQEKVLLLGYQHNPYKFMANARFFVLNSDHESFGNVLIEAFACDIPVVSNDCDFGPRHIIRHGYNGLLYNQTDETAFIEAMKQVALNDQLYKVLRQGAAESKYSYQVKTITDVWLEKIFK